MNVNKEGFCSFKRKLITLMHAYKKAELKHA